MANSSAPKGATPGAPGHQAVGQVQEIAHDLPEAPADREHLVDAPVQEGPGLSRALGAVVQPV
jgi:hypothetical protein